MSETQDRMIKIIQEQPDDSTFEEILEELEFDRLIEFCLYYVDSGRGISSEAMRRRIRYWRETSRKQGGRCKGTNLSDAQGRMIKITRAQPDDSVFEEIIEELEFDIMVRRGIADVAAGKVISSEEMRRRAESWRK